MEPSLADRAVAKYEQLLRRARTSFPDFCAFVFGFQFAPHHQLWAKTLDEHHRLVILAAIEHGKSSVISMAYPLFRLGRDPNLRILLVSETHGQASRLLAAVREAIDANPRVREVFPHLRPDPDRNKWSDGELVVRRSVSHKDPSILAVGVLGALIGARVDLAICDDVVSWGNSNTDAQRQSVVGWFRSTLASRITPRGKVVCVGTPWHPDDLLGQLQRSPEYRTVKSPAIDDDGSPLWPEVWPRERLEQRRNEIGEREFSRQMLLTVISDADSRFKVDWFDQAFRAAAECGATLVGSYSGPLRVYTGVDLAVGEGPQHDETAIVTIGVHPGRQPRRQILCIERGRWVGPEIVERIKSTFTRFRSRIRVESNGGQAYLAQFLRDSKVPVEAAHTGRNKHDPVFGVESMAVELARGQWVVPDAPETRRWMRELLAYSPSAHAGDSLMASWLARGAALDDEHERPLPVLMSGSRDRFDRYRGDGVIVARPGEFPMSDEEAWGPLRGF